MQVLVLKSLGFWKKSYVGVVAVFTVYTAADDKHPPGTTPRHL
jgi:hypothetical protein